MSIDSIEQEEKLSEREEAYQGEMPYIFISYSHKDSESVYPVIKFLKEQKFRVWYDEGIKVGRNYAEELFYRVSHCTALIVFLSENSAGSIHVANEIGIAFDNQITILPIWLSNGFELPANINYWIRFTHQHTIGPQTMQSEDKKLKLSAKFLAAIPDMTRDIAVVNGTVLTESEEDVRQTSIGPEITEIGKAAFKSRLNLSSVIFPPGIEKINDEAFRNCQSLTSLVLPPNITSIGASCFRDCISLVDVIIKKSTLSVTEIGERAFENCVGLKNVTLPDDLSEIFSGVFNSCKSLERIDIPNNVTVIGDSAFAGCLKLKEIKLSPYITKLDDQAFIDCTSLAKVDLPNGLTKLGKNVFKGCSALKKVSIAATVAKFGAGVFRGCVNLKEIAVEPKSKYLKSVDNVLYNKNKSELICHPAKKSGNVYEIPDSVTRIADWAFANCVDLEEVILPDTVTEIGEGAFCDCVNLKRIILPESVEIIDDTAFRNCKGLTEVVIKSGLARELGWGLFYGCNPELKVKCKAGDYEKYFKNKMINYELIEG